MSVAPTHARSVIVSNEEAVQHLRNPASYAEPIASVDVVETHMAYVFLTDLFAYKMKKAVCYEFLDFSTPELRHWACEEEVRLNRRLAPAVYLGLVSLVRRRDGRLRMIEGEVDDAVESIVKMRRLPRARMLDQLIRARTLRPVDIRAAAALLAEFYGSAAPEPITPDEYVAWLRRNFEGDVAALTDHVDHLPATRVRRIGDLLRERLAADVDVFHQRAAHHHIVEAHGDLRPEHICLTREPVIIDCLEFRRDFRLLDPVDELAFLGMECERLGAAWIGDAFMDAYAQHTGDRPSPRVITYHKAARALLRAKIAIWHLRNGAPASAGRWLAALHEYVDIADRQLSAATEGTQPPARC